MLTVWVAVALWLAVYGLPDLMFHRWQWGSVLGTRNSGRIGLTFDDGPGADTAAVLDVLARHGVTATFFVVAERAERHPDLIRRMIAEGHEIGVHGLYHRSAFLEPPWVTGRRIRRAFDILAAMTGSRPVVYRPPWGHFNLAAWWAGRRLGMDRVLWNIAPDDWRADRSPDRIARYVVQAAQPGTVVVLHDAGGDRGRTVTALDTMIPALRRLGMEPSAVRQLPRDASEFRRWWTWWEIRFSLKWDVDTIPASSGGSPVLRLGLIRYRGRPVRLADGVELQAGDPMGEIHFGNVALSRFSRQSTGALRAFHAVLKGLGDLAAVVAENPKYREVRAVGGVTLLDAAGAIERLGFERVAVKGWQKWWLWIYLIVLMAVYHEAGWSTLRRFGRLEPVLVLMSARSFLSRYRREGESGDGGNPTAGGNGGRQRS